MCVPACVLCRPQIYLFDGHPRELEGPWQGRLVWNGSKDLQELSISILNVTMNDTGTYNCVVFRQFEFDSYSHSVTKTLVINLVVREEGKITSCFVIVLPVLSSSLLEA